MTLHEMDIEQLENSCSITMVRAHINNAVLNVDQVRDVASVLAQVLVLGAGINALRAQIAMPLDAEQLTAVLDAVRVEYHVVAQRLLRMVETLMPIGDEI
jgi:hypothetical protein